MLRKLAPRVGLALFGVAAALSLGFGCVSTENERTLELAIGTRCTLNSDCTDPNVCVFGTCHAECNTTADCENGERCVKGEKGGANVCQLASESKCATSADCSGSQVCGVDGACRDGCKATTDCLTGQLCTQGTCAEQSEVDPSTNALPEDPAHVGEGQPCTYNTDCPEELACIESTCAFQCLGDKDCAAGQTCVDNFCKVTTVLPPDCTTSSQCGAGFLCVSNACVPGCTTDAECVIGKRCFGGQCVLPVFDASYSPDNITASDTSLFAIYNGQVLRCPNTGCNASNVVELFPLTYAAQPGVEKVITLGGSGPADQLLADGPAAFVMSTDYYLGIEFLYGCRDVACNEYIEVTIPNRAEAKTLREHQGTIVVYEVIDDGEGGFAFTGCTVPTGATASKCAPDFAVSLVGNGNAYPSTMAVQKGAKPAEDVVYVGWESGLIQKFDVADCVGGACAPTTVSQITDGIGLPIEVNALNVAGTDLFFLTGGTNGGEGGGGQFSVDRCASSSCTPSSFYTGFSFYYPLIAVGGGAVFIGDDDNVWKAPITN